MPRTKAQASKPLEPCIPVGALVMLLALLPQGCAAPGRPAARMARPMPSSPEQARLELAELEQEISDGRLALGLPARGADREVRAASPAGPAEAAAGPPRTMEPKEAEPSRALPAPHAAERSEADGEDVSAASGEETCPEPCRYTRAICDAAERICSLCGYLGDPGSAARCSRARQDCREARQSTRDTCTDCS